jgi:hypothetical protein
MTIRNLALLMGCLAAVFVILLVRQPARGFIDTFRPETLGAAATVRKPSP